MSDKSVNKRKDDDHWVKTYWRPAMAWSYFVVCLFDFLIAPIFFAWFSWITKTTLVQWQPLTVQGGGLFHLSYGAIIGVTSWQRSQERIKGPYYGQGTYYGQGPYQNSYAGQNADRTTQQNYPLSQSPIRVTDPDSDPER